MYQITKAAQYALRAHHGQTRKWTQTPYINHPMRVAGKTCLQHNATENMIITAWLHDTIEDTKTTYQDIKHHFGPNIANMVQNLTNPSQQNTNQKRPNRAKRMETDRKHIASQDYKIKTIKLIDRIDNLQEMQGAKQGFKDLYLKETQQLLKEALSDGPKNLVQELHQLCHPLQNLTLAKKE